MGIFEFISNSPERRIGKQFDRAVKDAVEQSGGEPLIAGVLVYSAIAKTYDSLKHDGSFIRQCGLPEPEFMQLLENVLNKKGREYVSNWDQMRGTDRLSDYMEY